MGWREREFWQRSGRDAEGPAEKLPEPPEKCRDFEKGLARGQRGAGRAEPGSSPAHVN